MSPGSKPGPGWGGWGAGLEVAGGCPASAGKKGTGMVTRLVTGLMGSSEQKKGTTPGGENSRHGASWGLTPMIRDGSLCLVEMPLHSLSRGRNEASRVPGEAGRDHEPCVVQKGFTALLPRQGDLRRHCPSQGHHRQGSGAAAPPSALAREAGQQPRRMGGRRAMMPALA